ncbi:MAG: ADOP family duplicated permease [Terriglobales bacterium]
MSWMVRVRTLARAVTRRSTVESEMAEELRFHVEAYASDLERQGVPAAEASRRARIEFGSVESAKEECRSSLGVRMVDELRANVRYALRSLRRSPGFAVVAVLTLALGICANTAIFTLIDSLLFRSAPVRNPEELYQVRINRHQSDQLQGAFTNALWESLRAHQDVFSGMAAWGNTTFDLTRGWAVRPADGIWVSGDFFSTLGVRPAAGRLITAEDDRRGCAAIAVLSYSFWQSHYGGSPAAVGSALVLDSQPFEIVGVAQRGFYGLGVGQKFDVAAPNCATALMDGARSRLDRRSWWWLTVVGRAKPQLSSQQVTARLRAVSPQVFAAALPLDWDKHSQDDFLHRWFDAAPAAAGVSWYLREQFAQPLWVLMAVAGIVLLIACANIAALLLARAAQQAREAAVRMALGASRLRLLRESLTHAVLLSLTGAAAGILLARWGTAFMVRCISRHDDPLFLSSSPDWRILAFTSVVALLTAAVFGVLPGLHSTRVPLTESMRGAGKTLTERDTPLRKAMVAGQIALSLALLITAGLFLRSFMNLATLDPGFDKRNVLLVSVDMKNTAVKPERQFATFEAIQERFRTLPGVVSVGRSHIVPLNNMTWDEAVHTDAPASAAPKDLDCLMNFVSPGYFATMRTALLAGRDFTTSDTKNSTPVAIVNEAFIRKFFPSTNPLGHVLRLEQSDGSLGRPIQIVGVLSDTKYTSLRDPMAATAFLPLAQIPEPEFVDTFAIRTSIRPASLIGAVEKAVGKVNAEVPLQFNTLEQDVDDAMVQERALALLSGFFGGVALLLAVIGLYGTVSYRVTLRRPEFGIRMALGARVSAITHMVLREVVMVLLPGITIGVTIALAAATAVQKLLFGLAPRDATTIACAAAVLAVVALMAAYVPARRAARTDPMIALRYE